MLPEVLSVAPPVVPPVAEPLLVLAEVVEVELFLPVAPDFLLSELPLLLLSADPVTSEDDFPDRLSDLLESLFDLPDLLLLLF